MSDNNIPITTVEVPIADVWLRNDYRDIVRRLGEVHMVRACEHQHDDDFVPMYDYQTLEEHMRKAESLRSELDRAWAEVDKLVKQLGDLTTLRKQDELVHGNIMGRIAANLFGRQNNVTDEDCVAETAAIGYRITSLYQRLAQIQEERNAANVELKVWQDRYQKLLECIAQAKAFEPPQPIVVEAGSKMVGGCCAGLKMLPIKRTARQRLETFANISRIQTDEETYDLERTVVGSVVAGITADRCGQCGACDRSVVPVDVGDGETDDVEMTLLERVEEAEAERDRLRAELAKHQESEFHPDWSMLEATRASLREHMEIIRGLRAELAFATQKRNAYQNAVDVACEERDRLRAELAAARELLRQIYDTLRGKCSDDQGEAYDAALRMAEAALAKEKKE